VRGLQPAPDVTFEILARYGEYGIETGAPHEDGFPDPLDFLTTGEDSWMLVLCGTGWGPVTLTVGTHAVPPAVDTDGRWDMIGERDIVAAGTSIEFRPMLDAPNHTILVTPGRYRVRVHVKDRAAAHALGRIETPHETHRVDIWAVRNATDPATLTPPDRYSRDAAAGM